MTIPGMKPESIFPTGKSAASAAASMSVRTCTTSRFTERGYARRAWRPLLKQPRKPPPKISTCNNAREATVDKQVFTPVETGRSARTEDDSRSVIVELIPAGGARIRKAPPDTMVMVVESQVVTAAGKRSLAAGARIPDLATDTSECGERPEPSQIPVSFPG